MLAFEPQGSGTDIIHALDHLNRVYQKRTIVFLVSDFQCATETVHKALFRTSSRHDTIAVDLHDPMERAMPGVGLLALQDAENGRTVWVDTASKQWRTAFATRTEAHEAAKTTVLRRAGVDHIVLDTETDYVSPLERFFKQRVRRRKRLR